MTGPDVRVVVADDHGVVREGLRALLGSSPGIEVVGEAVTGEQAVEVVLTTRPDVTVMDLEMPDGSGVDATRKILTAWPDARILVLTMHDHDASVFAAMRAGARGYVLKHASPSDVVRAVRAVAAGDAIFSPAIASRLIGFFSSTPTSTVPFAELTEREREVLELIARGQGNAEIARRLIVSPKTVRNHITNIFMKMQVADRAEAIARARDARSRPTRPLTRGSAPRRSHPGTGLRSRDDGTVPPSRSCHGRPTGGAAVEGRVDEDQRVRCNGCRRRCRGGA